MPEKGIRCPEIEITGHSGLPDLSAGTKPMPSVRTQSTINPLFHHGLQQDNQTQEKKYPYLD